MEKKFHFFRKLMFLTLLMLGVGSAFGAGEKCAAGTQWGGFTTVVANKGSDDYYEINTPEELAWFSCEITKNGGSSQKTNAKLMQSIDLQGKLFIPISAGGGTPSYGGTFDGQGFTIKNLFIDASEIVKSTNGGNSKFAQNIGFFAVLKGGTVKNVTLTNVEIYAASSAGDAGTNGTDNPISVGAIAGYLESGSITGCAVSGKIETSGSVNRVGGVAGNVWAATISDCISEADVIATGNNTHVGGILGAVRKDGDVTINSCVYAGETLFSDNGSVGAVVGNYEKNKDITTNDLYYSADYPAVGTGLGNRPFNSTQVDDLNTENVICELNGGSWNTNEGTCSNASPNGTWSEGQSNISINGSDGFKVTFDANGGNFTGGAKISKFFAKKASITANEIENPKYTGYKFVGWSLTQTGAVEDLGIADKAKTVYAVWKPIRTITFNATPGSFEGSSSVTSKLVAEGDVVTVEGLPALPVRFCSQGAEPQCDKYAYFNGWSTQLHAPYGEKETIPEGTIIDLPTFKFESDTTLYAVWIESVTYTVTFNANGHGQTKVAFVKVGKGDKTVQPPDPNPDDGYVFTNRWCLETTSCDENTKFDFDDTEIDTSIVLYADWNVPDYDITYMINGVPNTETGNQAKYNVESDPITLVKPDSAGYVFDGWYDEDGNEATTILSRSTGDKTFRGSWVPVSYTITYLADNTLSATTTSDVKLHGVAKTLKGATFAHGGCTQDGWSKVSYGKEGYNLDFVVNGSYEEDKDLILFPHWNCGTYNIIYEVYGMSVTNRNPGDYTGPAKITLENAFDPAKKYFFMDNWYKEPTFTTTIRDIQDIDANLTVYAKWYNKIYYKPGSNATGKAFEEKKYFDSTYTITVATNKFTRANYTIDGWSTTNGGAKVYELGETYTTNENLTLYPHWVENREVVLQSGAVTVYEYATDGRKEAVIDGEYTGADAVNIPTPIEVDNIIINRKFGAGVPSTIVLPFTLPEGATFNAKFYYLKNVVQNGTAWKATMKSIGTERPQANTPYSVICQGNDSLKFDLKGEQATLQTTELKPVPALLTNDWLFVGVYSYKVWQNDEEEITDGLAYCVAGQNSNGVPKGVFSKISGGVDAKPMRAYMRKKDNTVQLQPVAQTARAWGASYGLNNIGSEIIEVEFVDDEKTTAIGRMNTVTGEIKIDRWFDLKGRSVKNVNRAAKGAYYGKKGFHE